MEQEDPKAGKGTLINRNVIIDNHRTSIRLEAEMWNDLKDICRREGKSIHAICTLVNNRRPASRSLTSAIRVFLISYYRSAATEDGHYRAGHGENYKIANRISADMTSLTMYGHGRSEGRAEPPPVRKLYGKSDIIS